jgi:hypothetical protein
MTSAEDTLGHDKRVPLFVKIIILTQAAVIFSFTIGMYQEYQNNSYLQDYVVNLFRSSIVADVMLSMVTVSVFAIGTVTLLGSMITTRRVSKELKALSELASDELQMPTMPVLETVDTVPTPIRPAG